MDRLILKTRASLKDAFIQLVKNQPFDTITVQQIADTANVDRATFYKHYAHTHHLLAMLEKAVIEKVRQMIEARTPINGIEPLDSQLTYDTIVRIYEYMEEERELMEVLLHSNEQTTVITNMQSVFEQMLLRYFKQVPAAEDAVPLDVVVAYLASANIGVLRQWLLKKTGETPEQMACMLMKIFRAGPVVAITEPLQP